MLERGGAVNKQHVADLGKLGVTMATSRDEADFTLALRSLQALLRCALLPHAPGCLVPSCSGAAPPPGGSHSSLGLQAGIHERRRPFPCCPAPAVELTWMWRSRMLMCTSRQG